MTAIRAWFARMPRMGWLCALVAVLNGLAWAWITPPFHVPDEMSHFAYVQYLAETGDAPRHVSGDYMSAEEQDALQRLRFFDVIGYTDHKPIWTEAGQKRLDEVLDAGLDRVSDGSSSTAVNNPPLFYALQALPYLAASNGDLLDRFAAMRLLSVLLSALTVLCVFMFLREVFPATPWAWSAGALAAAFQPLFGFVSTGVNNDGALFLASAFLFLVLARCLRRGLTARRAVALGAAVGLGLVTKLTFLAFVPAVAVALGALVWQRRGEALRGTPRTAAVVLAVTALPVVAYLLLNELAWDRQLYGGLTGDERVVFDARPGSLGEELSYIFQLYLPRLPFQADLIAGEGFRHVWLNGLIGNFGWLDYGFPARVYDVGAVLAALVLLLAVAGAVRLRERLRARWLELAVYALAAAGLAVLIGRAGYSAAIGSPHPFEQARYLLPLLPLYASVLVLAARAVGERWQRSAAVLVVLVAVAHSLFAQLLTLSRYYG